MHGEKKAKYVGRLAVSDEHLKHLEFIQNVVTRMNTNSFQIKSWTVTIAAALLAVYASTGNNRFILVGLLPAVLFWFLDAYYLTQERKFRGLYNDVAGVKENPQDIKSFAMRPDLYTGGNYSYWKVFRSQTIWPLYGSLLILQGAMFSYTEWIVKPGG